jgi:anthranilate phosphoribosyltransferase
MMTHRMTMKYETVKYLSGAVGGVRPDTNVVGFADPTYYDTVRSAISRPGSNATVLGRGGLIDAGVGIVTDLQSGGVAGIVGALTKAGTAYDTFKDKNIRSIVTREVKDSATTILRGSLPAITRAAIGTTSTSTSPAQRGLLDGIFFPTPSKNTLPAPTSTEVIDQAVRNATTARR